MQQLIPLHDWFPPSAPTILIVEDNEHWQQIIVRLVYGAIHASIRAGHEWFDSANCAVASTLDEALTALNSRWVLLAIISADLEPPLHTVTALLKDLNEREIPTIVTGAGDSSLSDQFVRSLFARFRVVREYIRKSESFPRRFIEALGTFARDFRPVLPTTLLLGFVIDLSPSISHNIRNNTGGHLQCLGTHKLKFGRLLTILRDYVLTTENRQLDSAVRMFVHLFGLQANTNGDLFSLLTETQPEGHLLCRLTCLPLWTAARILARHEEALVNIRRYPHGGLQMSEVLENVMHRFDSELKTGVTRALPVLLIFSDGNATDDRSLSLVSDLKSRGIAVLSCFVADCDVADPDRLHETPGLEWGKAARQMFEMASIVGLTRLKHPLSDAGYQVNPKARLFIQVNHSLLSERLFQLFVEPFQHSTFRATHDETPGKGSKCSHP